MMALGVVEMNEIVLSVRNVVIEASTPRGPAIIVNNISFDVHRSETLGVVGESGSGKSVTMLSIMGLLQNSAVRVRSGEVLLNGRDLLRMSAAEMNRVRGKDVAMIFQDPMTSLNPVLKIGTQIAEMLRLNNPDMSRTQIRSRSIELLGLVNVPEPEIRLTQYPHQFSGGMRQRVMIAMAVANNPSLLIADEPTTALDVTIQAQVMDVLQSVQRATGMAVILVTHDLGLIAENADRVAVLYGGRLMETADVFSLFGQTAHPYTVGLLRSLPKHNSQSDVLYSVPGNPPSVGEHPPGCVFHPRCSLMQGRDICSSTAPPLREATPGHACACHFAAEIPAWAASARSHITEVEA